MKLVLLSYDLCAMLWFVCCEIDYLNWILDLVNYVLLDKIYELGLRKPSSVVKPIDFCSRIEVVYLVIY